MAGVFISYRREDSPGHAGRVFDRVRARFGADVVFMDVTAIEAGVDFVDAIEKAVGSCDALLAIIGPQWAHAADAAGRKRLDNPNDFIRLEIAGALKRGVRVVPVLVDGAVLPSAADLPDDLQPLLRRNAAELRDARWDADIDQLLAALARIVTSPAAPLRVDAPAGGRGLKVAAAAIVAVGAIAAGVYGPRACAPPPVDTTTAQVVETSKPDVAKSEAPKAEAPKAEAPKPAEPKPAEPKPDQPPTVPNVVGRSQKDAREILRRAGVDVARVVYRDDRSQAIDLVVGQSDARTGAPAVILAVVARAAVAIHHRPEDTELARGLASALAASKAGEGIALRLLQTDVVRADSVARVTYSDSALASLATDVTKDVNTWLRQTDPERPMLVPALHAPVVSRTIIIGLPERAPKVAALPDVRAQLLTTARQMLRDAGVNALEIKWVEAPDRKATEVIAQSEVPGRADARTVSLEVASRGTIGVYYGEIDRAFAGRFADALAKRMHGMGILVRLVRQPTVKPALVGKVLAGRAMKNEAAMVAAFASSWLKNELGRETKIVTETDSLDPPRFMFGLPSPQ